MLLPLETRKVSCGKIIQSFVESYLSDNYSVLASELKILIHHSINFYENFPVRKHAVLGILSSIKQLDYELKISI